MCSLLRFEEELTSRATAENEFVTLKKVRGRRPPAGHPPMDPSSVHLLVALRAQAGEGGLVWLGEARVC